jgi:hypothetical protein
MQVTAPDRPRLYRLTLLSPKGVGMGRLRRGKTVVRVGPAKRRRETLAPMDF